MLYLTQFLISSFLYRLTLQSVATTFMVDVIFSYRICAVIIIYINRKLFIVFKESLQVCSSSRWEYHFPFYVLRTFVGFYWSWEIVVVRKENIYSVWEKVIRSERVSSVCMDNIPSISVVNRPPPAVSAAASWVTSPAAHQVNNRPSLARPPRGPIPYFPPRPDKSH